MRLDSEQRDLLTRARIGMLALGGPRAPLVNPAAFHFGGGSLWMTTSRHAGKLAMARRDPRAAFLISAESRQDHGVLLQGMLEAYDPRSLSSGVRAVMQGPGFALNLAAYALKNAAFIGGYLLDLATIPADWWPHNRVVLRLRLQDVQLVPGLAPPQAAPERIPAAPARVANAVSRARTAQLCWLVGGRPVLAPAAWALDGDDALAWLPGAKHRAPRGPAPGALVIERHHPFRATRMLGVCLRGRLVPEPGARATIARRYVGELPEDGTAVRLHVTRVTSWRGFEVGTSRIVRPEEAAVRIARVR